MHLLSVGGMGWLYISGLEQLRYFPEYRMATPSFIPH
jgi:hypothetical protein